MTTIELSPTPLPPPLALQEGWLHDHLDAYNAILDAARHIDELLEASPSDKKAKDNLISARVAGYLLLELFDRRTILSGRPYALLAEQIKSSSREGPTTHDVVFEVGQWHRDYFIRTCAFGSFPTLFGTSVSFKCRPDIYQGVPHTPCTPFTSLLRHDGGYGEGLHGGRW